MSLKAALYPGLTLIASLATIALLRQSSLGGLTPVVAVTLIGGFALGFWRLHLRWAGRDLPWIPDEVFLASFEAGLPAAQLIKARKWMARRFSIPPQRLAPDQDLGGLARRLDFLANAYVGLDEIVEEMSDLYERAGEGRRAAGELTVASAARELVRLGLFTGSA
jgi:hypothetical protein